MALSLVRNMRLTRGAVGAYAAYLAADDFDNSSYAQRGTNTDSSQLTTHTAVSSLDGYTFTATGSCYAYDSGAVYGPFSANEPVIVPSGFVAHQSVQNLLLNAGSSGGLSTQDVAVSAVEYTLSFVGTGEVVLSGVHSATLTGTGANDRVALTFTPSAGTLTCTVTGSVTYASLNTGKASVIVPTTGSAATRGEALLTHNLFADGSALTDQDMLIWVKGTPDSVGALQWALEVYVTSNDRLRLYLDGSALVVASSIVGGASVYHESVAGAVPAGTEVTLLLRRIGGNWRLGKYVSGTLTWGTEAAGTFPAGMTKLSPGNAGSASGTVPFSGTIDSAFIETGTFDTDAKVITAITGAP